MRKVRQWWLFVVAASYAFAFACTGEDPALVANTPDVPDAGPEDAAPADAAPADAGVPPCLRDDAGACLSVRQAATGAAFTCAVVSDGTVRCWGVNQLLALGDVSSEDAGDGVPHRSAPTNVDLPDQATQVAASLDRACAVLKDGSVWCWGRSLDRELGYPDAGDVGCTCLDAHSQCACMRTPRRVEGLPPAKLVQPGIDSTCAITVEGAVHCWGTNHKGQLGNGSTSPVASPVPVVGLEADVTALSLSAIAPFACAIRGGEVFCWGARTTGNLGYPPVAMPAGTCADCEPTPQPVQVGGVRIAGATSVACGDNRTCITSTDGHVYCWGWNGAGGLARPLDDVPFSEEPLVVPSVNVTAASSICGSAQHVCVLNTTKAWCWGSDLNGALGDGVLGATTGGGCYGGRTCRTDPTGVDTSDPIVEIACMYHSVARTANGGLFAWGTNEGGELGHAPRTQGDKACSGSSSQWCNPVPTRATVFP